MALSEEEQRLLAQLEASLSVDDPALARTMRGTTDPMATPRRLGLAAAGMVLGVSGLVAGVLIHPLVGVLGFVLMLVSASLVHLELPEVEQPQRTRNHSRSTPRHAAPGPFPQDVRPTDETR